MTTEPTEKCDSPKPLYRKRRVASLTAQTLWNIQLEDNRTSKIVDDFLDDDIFEEIEKTIPLRASAKKNKDALNHTKDSNNNNKVPKKRGRKRKSETSERVAKVSAPKTSPTANIKVFLPLGGSKTFKRKGKLTAAVAPLIMATNNAYHGHDSKTFYQNSQKKFHPNQFDTCLYKKPDPMFTCVKCQKQVIGYKPNMYNTPFNGRQCIHQENQFYLPPSTSTVNDDPNLQDQPLNLKLGETSIPSKKAHKQTVIIKSVNHNNTANLQTQDHQIKNTFVSNLTSNSSNYDAISPASSPMSTTESSCSTESEELRPGTPSVMKRRRKSSQKVNLRVIAAPPPGSGKQARPSVKLKKAVGKTVRVPILPLKDILKPEDSNNGWKWDGKPYYANVFSMTEMKPVKRRCYPAMRRKAEDGGEDDVVMLRDCVLLLADGSDQQSYVAKVVALWQHPQTGVMMISALWFYRPEHTEDTRVLNHVAKYSDDELFASRHLDEISVACVEDKCYVLTYAQYCRYTALQTRDNFVNLDPRSELFPDEIKKRGSLLPHQRVPEMADPNLVYFARKFYDVKLRRVLKFLPPPTPLFERT